MATTFTSLISTRRADRYAPIGTINLENRALRQAPRPLPIRLFLSSLALATLILCTLELAPRTASHVPSFGFPAIHTTSHSPSHPVHLPVLPVQVQQVQQVQPVQQVEQVEQAAERYEGMVSRTGVVTRACANAHVATACACSVHHSTTGYVQQAAVARGACSCALAVTGATEAHWHMAITCAPA